MEKSSDQILVELKEGHVIVPVQFFDWNVYI